MGQLVLGVAGAVVGGIVGGPTGAEIGWSIGSGVGAMLDKKPVEGPKLNDFTVTTSTWGTPIGRAFGMVKVGGNVIWSTPLIEHKEAVSGKGGPAAYEYSYTVSMVIALCEGPILDVRRIWKDGKLALDKSGIGVDLTGGKVVTRPDGSVVSDIDVTTQAETAIANLDISQYMKVYRGTEDQLPSPTMIAHEGEENVSAYRGIALVEFVDLPLKDLNNRAVGTWEFEVVTTGESKSTSIHAFTLEPEVIGTDPFSAGNVVPCSMTPTQTRFALQRLDGTVVAYNSYAGVPTNQPAPINLGLAHVQLNSFVKGSIGPVSRDGGGFAVLGYGPGEDMELFDANQGSKTSYILNTGLFAIIYDNNGFEITRVQVSPYAGKLSAAHAYTADGGSIVAVAENVANNGQVIVYKPGEAAYVPMGLHAAQGFIKLAISENLLFATQSYGQSVSVYDLEQPFDAPPAETISVPDHTSVAAISYVNGILYASAIDTLDGNTGSILACKYSAGERSLTELARYTPPDGMVAMNTGQAAVLWTDGVSAAMTNCQTSQASGGAIPNGVLLIDFKVPTPSPVTAASIVERLCADADVAPGKFDASALTDTVPGYMVVGMSPRDAISPLLQYCFADSYESDIIHFVKRGGAPSFDIPADDLGASIDIGQPTDLLQIERTENLELPRELAVVYSSMPATYAVASQYARRQTQPGANQSSQVQVPIVMEDEKAAQIAEVLLYDAWTARTAFSFQTTMKYAAIMPTDVGYVTQQDGRKYLVRITKREESAGIVKFQAVAEKIDVYTSQPAHVPMTSANQVLAHAGVTELLLLDLPILRDNDAPGLYAAVAGYSTGWNGGFVYRSTDDVTYTAAMSFSKTISFGAATTALPDFAGGNVIDDASTVIVKLSTGSLYSVTDDDLLAYKNAALIGDEIVLFRTATQIADKTYRLSGFLRGRKGTEFAMSGHQVGDRFVLLDPARIGDLAMTRADLGVARHYKGVSSGQYPENTSSTSFAWTGAAYRPLAPVHVEGGRLAGGDIQLQWIPRTRTDGEWNNTGDVVLSDAELYDVEIYAGDGTTLKRTISGLTTAKTVYTAAQQAADFGGATSNFVVHVYHISNIVGRGKPGTATINL